MSRPSRRCDVDNCGDTQFYEAEGLVYCNRYGHLQQGLVETEVINEGARITGKVHKSAKPTDTILKPPTSFKPSSLSVFLSIFQQLLREQCRALIDRRAGPKDLEPLVKDLWALRLPLITDAHHVEAPQSAANEGEAEASGSATDTTLFSSQGFEDDAEVKDRIRRRRRMIIRCSNLPGLLESLATIYLAFMLLRTPVLVADLANWASNEEIPYLFPLRNIPRTIKRFLGLEHHNLLLARGPIQPGQLHGCIWQLFVAYRTTLRLELPPLNSVPLLVRLIADLALPIETFSVVQELCKLTEEKFEFSTPSPKLSRTHRSLPELRLIAFVAVAVKLYHPFEDGKVSTNQDATESGLGRHVALSTADPACLSIDWSSWIEAHRSHDRALALAKQRVPGGEVLVGAKDVFDLSKVQMDKYLDWYERSLILPHTAANAGQDGKEDHSVPAVSALQHDLHRLFPSGHPSLLERAPAATPSDIQAAQRDANQTRLRTVLQSLIIHDISPDDGETHEDGLDARSASPDSSVYSAPSHPATTTPVARAGKDFSRVAREEDLVGAARSFYEIVATVGALRVKTLVRVVRDLEGHLRAVLRQRNDTQESS